MSASLLTLSCAGACGSTCTDASAASRPSPASTVPSTSRGTSRTTSRSNASACEPGEYIGISEENVSEYRRTAEAVHNGLPLTFETEAVEYAPQVIHALATGTRHDIYATVRNEGWIDNLPQGSAVEVPVLVDGDGAHPQAVGILPDTCAALNRRFLDVVGLTIEAAVTGDPSLVRSAALLDPNTSATLTPDQIDVLLTELSKVHALTLPSGLSEHDYTNGCASTAATASTSRS